MDLEMFEFEIPGKNDSIHLRRGDLASFVYTGRNGSREDLVRVENRTLGKTFKLCTQHEQFVAPLLVH